MTHRRQEGQTVAEHIVAYRDWLRDNASRADRDTFRAASRAMFRLHGNLDVTDFHRLSLNECRQEWADNGATAAQIRLYEAAVESFLTWAADCPQRLAAS